MNQAALSPKTLSVIDAYEHFKLGSAVCSVPYFNNKHARARAALRVKIGKGNPGDILEEAESSAARLHLDISMLADESLKKFLVDNDIGIECSGFAYHVLDSESLERKAGSLGKRLKYVNATGLLGKVRAALRPAENCDVATMADDANSRIIQLDKIRPGDMIIMADDADESERDHVLVTSGVDWKNSRPVRIYYVHAIAYPEDSLYGTGIKRGLIDIPGNVSSLADCLWSESGSIKSAERLFNRALKSRTEIRRLKWF